jgi:enterochelin esterase-like enzyme
MALPLPDKIRFTETNPNYSDMTWFLQRRLWLFLILLPGYADGFAQVAEPYIKYTYDDLPVAANGAKFYHCKYWSDVFDTEVGYLIFLPKHYFERSDSVFPVLYYFHGSGGNYINESSRALIWNESMEDSFPEMVIVLVNPVIDNYYYQKTEASVVNELRTHIIQTYRVSDKGECTAICGFSLGGQGAVQLALNHSFSFSQTVVLSGGPFQDIEAHISNYKANGTGNLNIRVTVGTEDRLLSSSHWLKEALETAGIPFFYKEYEGIGHSSEQTFGDPVYRTETFQWQTENMHNTCPVTLRNADIPPGGEYDLPFVNEYNPIAATPVPPNVFKIEEISSDEIQLTWAPNPKPVRGYFVQKIIPGEPGYLLLDSVSAETFSYTDSLEITCDSIYSYRVFAFNDVGTSSPFLAKVRSKKCTGLTLRLTESQSVRIYPNPAHNRLFIDLEEMPDTKDIVFEISDAGGRLVMKKRAATCLSEIELSGLQEGNYIIRIFKKNDCIYSAKITLR